MRLLKFYVFIFIGLSSYCTPTQKTLLILTKAITRFDLQEKAVARAAMLSVFEKNKPIDRKTLLSVVKAYHHDHETLLSPHVPTINQSIAYFHDRLGLSGKLCMLLRNADNASLVKGHIYELETAIKLYKQKEEITQFGYPFICPHTHSKRAIDLATHHSFIECKNICWSKFNPLSTNAQNVHCIQKQLLSYRYYADGRGLPFILHSKQSIPVKWQQWLMQNKIAYDHSDAGN